MVAVRKLFPVLAVFAMLLGAQMASAQNLNLSCNVTAGVPPVVRSEGFTELAGDLVITCTGGAFQNPFLANFQVFLNTNITSRLVTGDLSEALLLIDDPTDAAFCASPNAASNGATVLTAGGVSTVVGPNGTPLPAIGPTQGATTPTCGAQYNVFRGQRTISGPVESTLVWSNVPVVPPGSTGQRTFRITNLRVNATTLSSSISLPGSIVAFVSVTPPGTLPLQGTQQTIGYTQPGLAFDVRNTANSDVASTGLDQCVANASEQRDLFADPSAVKAVPAFNQFRFREGFQAAFKPRIIAGQSTAAAGTVYNSESGFVRSIAGATNPNVGLADAGTRLAVRFQNIPANLRIFVTNRNVSSDALTANRAVLVTTDQNGAFGSSPTPITGIDPASAQSIIAGIAPPAGTPPTTPTLVAPPGYVIVEVPIVNGTGVAVWEIVDNGQNSTLTGTNEELLFPYALAYRYQAQVSGGLPQVALGVGTATGSFAPFYSTATVAADKMSQTLPIPRFIQSSSTPSTIVTVRNCQTNLLFPYVTNWAGFDTGIAIANTSEDQPGFNPTTGTGGTNVFSDPQNRRQAGRCRLNYFGRLPNGSAPTKTTEQTDRNVEAGETITMVLSTGGSAGLTGNANFQGYIIAQCDFRFAHGFAFITDGPIGQARVAEGYLALVLDGGTDTTMRLRGSATGENRSN